MKVVGREGRCPICIRGTIIALHNLGVPSGTDLDVSYHVYQQRPPVLNVVVKQWICVAHFGITSG